MVHGSCLCSSRTACFAYRDVVLCNTKRTIVYYNEGMGRGCPRPFLCTCFISYLTCNPRPCLPNYLTRDLQPATCKARPATCDLQIRPAVFHVTTTIGFDLGLRISKQRFSRASICRSLRMVKFVAFFA